MNIVLWGTCDTNKPRIRILRDGLRAHGAEIIEVHAPVWEGVEDKSSLGGMGEWASRVLRLIVVYPRLIWRYLRAPAHDLVLVSYPGQLDVLIIRLFAWVRRKPVAFDWFISIYDTVVNDRRILDRRNPLAWMLWVSEWLAVRAANFSFMDTATHARRMEDLFGMTPGSLGHVWVGAEARFFQSGYIQRLRQGNRLSVLFYGQFIPLHGIDTIIEAARLTRDEPIRWILVGRGQEAPRIRDTLERDPLPNLEWLDWVAYEQLPDKIARADICLGIFGTSGKASSVIPNKVFQIVAAGRPLITRDSAAIRELLDEARPCTTLVEAGNALALAEAVRRHLSEGTRAQRRLRCHAHIADQIDSTAIGRQFDALVKARLHLITG